MRSKVRRLHYWTPCLFFLIVALPFLASACMWGVVTNATNGQPVDGAMVMVLDSKGNTRTAVTNPLGVYVFDQSGPSLALGDAQFFVTSQDQGAQTEMRTIDYADNPNANFSDPSSFREIQVLHVPGNAGFYHDLTQGYTMQFPDSWMVLPMTPEFQTTLSSSMIASGIGTNMTFGMCVVESDPTPPGGMPEHWWRNISSDTKIQGRTNDTIAGMPATRLVMTFNVEGNQYLSSVESDTWVFVRQPQVWFIQCMTDPKSFSSQEYLFGTVAESFKFDH